jgi:hypothetical protein
MKSLNRRWTRIGVVLAGGLLFLIYLAADYERYVVAILCDTNVRHEFISPEDDLAAIVFERDCGATSGFNTQVSIKKNSWTAWGVPPSFIAMRGNQPVTVEWLENDKIVISLPGDAAVGKNEPVKGLNIELSYF